VLPYSDRPGGFEGFGSVCVLVNAENLAVAQQVDLKVAPFDFGSARPPTAPEASSNKHAVSDADEFLHRGLGVLPCLPPTLLVLLHRFDAVERPLPRP
jgi:hypothetical protein